MKKTHRLTFQMPNDLLDKLKRIAEYEQIPLNEKIEQIISKKIENFEREHGKIPDVPDD